MKEKRLFLRSALLLCGSLVMGAGIGLCIASGQGSDPLAVLWDGLARTFSVSINVVNLLTAAVLILLILLVDWRQLNVGTIVYQLVMTGACQLVLNFVHPQDFWPQLAVVALGVFLTGVGGGIYSAAALGKGPYEGAVFGLHRRFGFKIAYVRMSMDALFLLSGFLLGGTVGLGTIMAWLGIGFFMEKTVFFVRKQLHLPEEKQVS